MPYQTYPYELPPLPCPYGALEPYIDAETMCYHHDKHFRTYIENLNKALQPYPELQRLNLVELLKNPQQLPEAARTSILNNGGGVYNHMLFFQSLAPACRGNHCPQGELLELICHTFGSFEDFKRIFSEQAISLFGSGWVYLVLMPDGQLKIMSFKNQDTPITENAQPILLIDVWEHAYYLKYKNLRKDYVCQIWNVLTFPVCR